MRALSGELLPVPLVECTSKASFGGVFWSCIPRRSLRGGTEEACRQTSSTSASCWQTGVRLATTRRARGLLQAAWLASAA
jgi:hypothetical protein